MAHGMVERSRKPASANPFYVVLLLVSTAFVVTALGYLVGPFVQQRAIKRPQAGPDALSDWFDRRGPLALGIEFALMFVCGLLAMATEHWFSRRSRGSSGSPPLRN
jgi:hypothetical protein